MKPKLFFMSFLLCFACRENQVEKKQVTIQDITYEVVELSSNNLVGRLVREDSLYKLYQYRLLHFFEDLGCDFNIDKICYLQITNHTNNIMRGLNGTKDSLLLPSSFDRSSTYPPAPYEIQRSFEINPNQTLQLYLAYPNYKGDTLTIFDDFSLRGARDTISYQNGYKFFVDKKGGIKLIDVISKDQSYLDTIKFRE